MKLPVCLSLCLLLLPCLSSATTLNFEDLADQAVVTNQYAAQGVTFSNALALKSGLSLNDFDFPPHSGLSVISDNGNGPLQIFFSTPETLVSLWITYNSGLTVKYFDSVGTLQGVFAPPGAMNTPTGAQFSIPFSGVSRLDIVPGSGFSVTIDDLSFVAVNAVPEPATASLLSLGMLALCYRRSKTASSKAV